MYTINCGNKTVGIEKMPKMYYANSDILYSYIENIFQPIATFEKDGNITDAYELLDRMVSAFGEMYFIGILPKVDYIIFMEYIQKILKESETRFYLIHPNENKNGYAKVKIKDSEINLKKII